MLLGCILIIGRGGGGSAGACIQWLRDDVYAGGRVAGQGSVVSGRLAVGGGEWVGGEGAVSGPEERVSVGVVVVLGVMWDGSRGWSVAAVMDDA